MQGILFWLSQTDKIIYYNSPQVQTAPESIFSLPWKPTDLAHPPRKNLLELSLEESCPTPSCQ